MTGTVVGAQREVVVAAALPVVRLLAALMMVMVRVVYAAAVLDRTCRQSRRRRCQREAWIICVDYSPLPTWREEREREKKERE